MGMIAYLAGVDDVTMARLQANPDDVAAVIYPPDGHGEDADFVDLDKAWHCIHFMLTGSAVDTAPTAGWSILGGTELGEDMGMGPARVLAPGQVRSVAAALDAIDEDAFTARYAPDSMVAAEVYLSDSLASDGDAALDYIVQNYRSLRTFYRDTAAKGHGAILWLS
ncbi:YfbM family protein [Pseudoduganella aquatica]|uniref:DUF1877 family protein n=1 Tax=Pseudoduganella aquatica TaxID=2660641 RepID=A0A7X4HGZ2_9BURK|nr:YfbM family protein [Pseudoduganella aquatica]MYN09965.1 DUF1877 family protein [Pseudoduganella aquatica]